MATVEKGSDNAWLSNPKHLQLCQPEQVVQAEEGDSERKIFFSCSVKKLKFDLTAKHTYDHRLVKRNNP